MSDFHVKIRQIDKVEPHPNADRLTLNYIGDYIAISNKHEDGSWRHKVGDLVVYVPEAAVVPDWILKRYGYWNTEKDEGILAGSNHNRVKAIRLRGIFSQGLVLPLKNGEFIDAYFETETGSISVHEGDDIAEQLNILKYEPPIPTSMNGEVCSIFGHTLKFDIENIKGYPNVILDEEMVVITEKIHGTFVQIGIVPGLNNSELIEGECFVASKGLGGQGLVFKDNEANKNNLYMSVVKRLDVFGKIRAKYQHVLDTGDPFYILGEVYGEGVQDLGYGKKEKSLAVFDIYLGRPGEGRFVGEDEKAGMLRELGLDRVPVLYRGPFNKAVLLELTEGKTTVQDPPPHLREGVVVVPVEERHELELGRVILKSVSETYLLRKGNVTEYQ